MSKPKAIIEIEQQFDIQIKKVSKIIFLNFGESFYLQDIDGTISGLSLHGIQISDYCFLKPLSQLTSLNLSDNNISNISFLKSLTKLTALKLSFNKISDIESLQHLTNLTSLDLTANRISDIRSLQHLTQLTSLELTANRISDYSNLKLLTQLTSLDLRYNNIADFRFLKPLTQLTEINLSDNNITDISFLKPLTKLNSLDLSYNNITDISFLKPLTKLTEVNLSYNQITDSQKLKSVLFVLKGLINIDVNANPLAIPSSCLDSLKQLRSYFDDGDKGITDNRTIKLLFLGDGCVGKSTLLEHLKTLTPPKLIPADQRTEGIQLDIWKDYFPNYNINVWDFGGQEILHSTHRLFLGERALYILVWCHEDHKICTKEEVHPLSYWLDFIADFGRKSIVLLVENVINGNFSNDFPDDKELKELIKHYKTKEIELIPSHHRYDCLNNTDDMREFKDIVKNKINQLQNKFPIEDYPSNWHAFQEQLEKEKTTHKTITIDRYYELSKPFDLSNPTTLLNYFNDIGVLGYFEDLDNLIVLQMGWILDAVYAGLKLKNNVLLSTKGKLNDEHFELLWPNYNQKEKALFIVYMLKSRLMAKPNFLQFNRNYQYLIPALFDQLKSRDRIKWEEKKQYIVIQFQFIFIAIMQQLQVRILNHCHYEEEETFYQNYMSFTDRTNNDAYIELINDEKELRIYSKSIPLIDTILNEVNQIYPLGRVNILQRTNNMKDASYKFDIDKKKLFDAKIKPDHMPTIQKEKKKIFVTYSWSDENGIFDEQHQNRVGQFVDQLRENWGFDASFDLYQKESNFIKMMYQNLKSAYKVIIVLSKGYAHKANTFKNSGVEIEYTAIVNDIKEYPDKYILLAFDSRAKDIYPYGLQGNDTIVLKEDLVADNLPEEQNRLLSKLKDEPIYDKPEIAPNSPKVRKKKF